MPTSTNASDDSWHQDEKSGLWYRNNDLLQPYASDYSKIPFTVDDILSYAHDLACQVGTAALTTVDGMGFPHSRLVSPGKHIAKDFSEVSVATRLFTRKVGEIQENPLVSLFWQNRKSDRSSSWVAIQGTAVVKDSPEGKPVLVKYSQAPSTGENKDSSPNGELTNGESDADGSVRASKNPEQKGKVFVDVWRLEMQDYENNITGHGWDTWKPCVLERDATSGKWTKVQ